MVLQLDKRGVCLVLSAPSGAGKSTIANRLKKTLPDLKQSVSVTTRAPRPQEKDGIHYHFRNKDEFEALIEQDGFIEWARVFDNYYGTPRAPIEDALQSGANIILDVDWQGFRLLKKAFPNDVVGIFILPPDLEELEKRLRGRNSDSDEIIKGRMDKALREIEHWNEFDYLVVNDDLDEAVERILNIVKASEAGVARYRNAAK